ncbi:hypothetical protein MLD38_025363 [Melastoma candidum]|uniref:Uncharacterized protein n=1 Tax=Melastoma candidum TaxID=119954 RepID=A0ACB9NW43_9MYRT|nr:hypothetical protein MLD38_025363 [Melastoma candidum]
MQPKSDSDKSNPTESNLHTVPAAPGFAEPWWRGIGYNPIPSVEQGKKDSQPSSFRCSNGGSDSFGGRSQSDEGESEDDEEDSPRGSRNAASPQSRQAHGKETQSPHPDPSVPSMHDDHAAQAPLLELVGHSIACASNPYQDPYYGGMVAAYGHPSMAYPFVGIPHARMPLPLDLAQEPVYVNAKQFQGILRRRQARAKAEPPKLIKVRKPYLHESRHQHAMRRTRGSGGRFAKKTETGAASAQEEKGATSGPTLSSQSASSSGSERLATDSTDIWNSSSIGQQTRDNTNGNGQVGFKPCRATCDLARMMGWASASNRGRVSSEGGWGRQFILGFYL